MNHWSKNRAIAFVMAVVLAHAILLFAVIPLVSARLASAYSQEQFADGYDQLAANLVAGNGYRFYPDTAKTLMREPGYPLLLAGLFFTFGNSFAAVKAANMLLALATAWLMMKLGRKLSSNPWLIYLPPLLFLFHPGTLVAESRGGVEIFFGFLFLLFVLTMSNALEKNKWQSYVVSGFALGATVLVRSVPIMFPIFLFGYLLVFERRKVSVFAAIRNIGLQIAVMFVVLSPWIIRNYSITGKFVPTASVLGVSAHAGQYMDTHLFEGRPWWLLDREAARERSQLALQLGYPFKDGYYQSFYNSNDEIKFSKYLFARVMDEYKKYPVLFLKCLALNIFNFWFTGKTWTATAVNIIIQLPYLLLAVAGVLVAFQKKQVAVVGPWILLIAYTVAVYLPILAQARYSVPLVPLLSIFATLALISGWTKMNKNKIESNFDLNVVCDVPARGELAALGREKQ